VSVIVKDKEYPLPPEGLHNAICIDVEPIVSEPRDAKYGGGIRDSSRVVWALDEKDPQTGKQYIVSKRYTLSLHEKATLAKDATSWRGRPFTPEERKGFDMEKLILVPCQLLVVHSTSESSGKTYANVEKVMKAKPGAPLVTVPSTFTRKKDRVDASKVNGNAGQPFEATAEDVPF
jgi:hypothetical protein